MDLDVVGSNPITRPNYFNGVYKNLTIDQPELGLSGSAVGNTSEDQACARIAANLGITAALNHERHAPTAPGR